MKCMHEKFLFTGLLIAHVSMTFGYNIDLRQLFMQYVDKLGFARQNMYVPSVVNYIFNIDETQKLLHKIKF